VSRRDSTSLACAALAALAGGCLDAGPTPLGRHLVTSRAPEQVQLIDGAVGAPRRILLTRSLPPANDLQIATQEISTVDDPGPGGGASEARVIATNIASGLAHCTTPECPTPIDSLGRIYMYRSSFMPIPGIPGGATEVDTLVRVDPATATEKAFGPPESLQLSPDRTRAVIQPEPQLVSPTQPAASLPYLVVDVDDQMTMIAGNNAQFAGDDLYLLDDTNQLSRLPRGSRVLEGVAANVDRFGAYATARGPVLILTRFADRAMNGPQSSSIFDATTRTEEPLAAMTALAAMFTFSPNGRYISTLRAPLGTPSPLPDASDTTTLTLYDRDTGQEMVATGPAFVTQPKWRPGRDEVWFDESGTDLLRWPVGGQPQKFGAAIQIFGFPTLGPSSPQTLATEGDPIFTPDGRFRVFPDGFEPGGELIAVQSADDPAAPFYQLNQPNMSVAAIWPLADGRLLVENFLADPKKNDAFLVDPAAQVQLQFASTGNVVATGRDRCLALLNWVASGGSGDLTIVDYATGAQTLIAQNVHSVALDDSADADDALAAGTRVAFLVRNRIASPYDGLWVIELP
jgi:hypothetical protein